ncbi:PAS domain S-box protein [Pontibacter sp. BT310]|uniref:histidine kinase n=1 Tax=Pontibacter populi TaxID=890055 RepID=A0ABS6XD74_9BACT|nr:MULTISPECIES: PAS domain S-box protein [Pontibacter]MBJ6119098.1 PAS domain S-box protein [Pontibacter sp. BT310]MBR0571526.1 PAS domain S-box protein [Microvirga sp. STS03]MBW3365952.1 PAS domain S-box protein [Pontibacter populi]
MNSSQDEHHYSRQKITTRYAAIAFAVLAVALLTISVYSYLTAREVQENYNQMVSDSLYRLELISDLHNKEDFVYNTAIKHINSTDAATMARLEYKIQQANEAINNDLVKLEELIIVASRKQLLQQYVDKRNQYAGMLDNLIELSRKGRQDQSYEELILTPAYHRQQKFLNELGDTISTNTRKRGTDALQTIDSTIRNYNMLLLASLLVTAFAAIFIRKAFNQLRFSDAILSTEKRERQQLKNALNESQALYRSLFRNIAIPMWVFDYDTRRILEVNQAALEEYGYTRAEFLNLTIMDLQPEDQVADLVNLLPLFNENYRIPSNWKHVRKDGSVFFVDIKTHGLPPQGNFKPKIVVAINIDDRVKAISNLERREKQLLEISSSVPGAVYQFQVDKEMNFSFPFISGSLLQLYGVTSEDIYQNPHLLFEAAHPDELEYIWESIRESVRTLTPWLVELRMWSPPEEKWIWIRGHSLPTQKEDGTVLYNGTLIDITTQKEAQQHLIQSEANLTALLNSSPQAIYLLDKDLKILSFNKVAAEEVKRLQVKELKEGQSILDFTAEDQQQDLIQDLQKALRGNTVSYETGRGNLWFEISYRPVFTKFNDTIAVALSINDISEQRNIVKAIKENEAQLVRSQSLAKVGSWEYDLERNQLKLSQNTYTIYELPEDFTPTFHNITSYFHPDDQEFALQEYQRVVDSKETVHMEHRILLQNGNQKYLYHIMEPVMDMEGKVIKVVGTTQDITEQKEREHEITEAKNRFQSTIENIPEIILSADTNSNILYISPQCFELTGYTEDEFISDELWPKIIVKEDIPLLKEKFENEALQGHKFEQEFRIITRSGEIRWMMLRSSPMLNADGKVIRLDSSVADITAGKLAEAKQAQLTEKLQLQNQNLQQFAYIVSHNLRAPIANLLGLSSIYDRTNPEAPINQRVIDNMFRSARLLDSTIRDLNELLAMRNDQHDAEEEVYFEEIFQHVTESLSDEITEAEATLTHDFTAKPAIVTIRSYLKSIIHNLVSNAIKYRDRTKKLQINLKTSAVDDYICLQVSDNGLGIDLSKEKGKVFGLYKRFHPNIAGKGLGLHLVKSQAELLGGKVEVESNVGVGTTFRVYFLKSSVVNEYIEKGNTD